MALIQRDGYILKALRIYNATLLYIFHKIFRGYKGGALL